MEPSNTGIRVGSILNKENGMPLIFLGMSNNETGMNVEVAFDLPSADGLAFLILSHSNVAKASALLLEQLRERFDDPNLIAAIIGDFHATYSKLVTPDFGDTEFKMPNAEPRDEDGRPDDDLSIWADAL